MPMGVRHWQLFLLVFLAFSAPFAKSFCHALPCVDPVYALCVSRVFVPLLLPLGFPRYANMSLLLLPRLPLPPGSVFTQDRERIVAGEACRQWLVVDCQQCCRRRKDGVRR
jgi:hypothetical protein